MPAYNHERFVEEAVRSVWDQSYPNVELIVLNDGSSDATGQIVDRLSTLSPIPMRVVHKENEGLCRTLNQGVGMIAGAYVTILASDDAMHPEKLAREVAYLESAGPEVAGCYGDMVVIDEESVPTGARRMKPKDAKQDMFFSLLLAQEGPGMQAGLFRALDFIQNGAFDESLKFEDLDFMLRLTRNRRVDYIGGTSVRYRYTEGSLAKSLPDLEDDFCRLVAKHEGHPRISELGRFGQQRVWAATWFRMAAMKQFGQRPRRDVLGAAFRSLRHWPLEHRSWGVLGLAFVPRRLAEDALSIRRALRAPSPKQ